MTAVEAFIEWAKSEGCEVEIWQEDDGNGYTCLFLTTPKLDRFDLTVTETATRTAPAGPTSTGAVTACACFAAASTGAAAAGQDAPTGVTRDE